MSSARPDDEVTKLLEQLSQDPLRAEPYRGLLLLYQQRGDLPRALCAAEALAYLRKLSAEEAARYEELRRSLPQLLTRSAGCLTDDAWLGCVYRSDQSRFVSAVFAAVAPALAVAKGGEARRFGLDRAERRDLDADQTLLGNVLRYTTRLLNLPAAPEVYFRPGQPGGLQVASVVEGGRAIPSLVVGQELLSGHSAQSLAFRAGALLAKLRPEHVIRLLVPAQTELRVLLWAAVTLATGLQSPPLPSAEQPLLEPYRAHLRGLLSLPVLEHLQRVAQFQAQQPGGLGAPVDLAQWTAAVDLTANRAGLIACGDLELALQIVSREPVAADGAATQEKVQDLLRYGNSPRYHAARQFLGL